MIRYSSLIVFLLIPFLSMARNDTTLSRDTIGNNVFRSLRFDDRIIATRPVKPLKLDIKRHEKKNFWLAAGETFGFNMGLWAFDRYVQKGPYAYISLNTIKQNFRHGFEWDNDHLGTNMFLHPYNGAIFFNAGRSNGFNFWQSELFAIAGSGMWEMFMEREYPSTNDIIATPIGGAAIGEVLYRTSDLIVDDRTSGGERLGRELATFIVDPMRGITRLVTGRAWKKRNTSGRRFGIPPISIELSLGARLLTFHNGCRTTKAGGVTELYIEYGDRFEASSTTPYSYFSFLMELQMMKTQPVLGRMEIMGRLLSHEIIEHKDYNVSVGLYQHFDFFDSDTIKIQKSRDLTHPCVVPYKMGTPASIGLGTMFRVSTEPSWVLDGYFHFNTVILAGVLTDFYRDYHRNYNWGSGYSIKAGLHWAMDNNHWSVNIANQFYKLYTWRGYDENYYWNKTGDEPEDVQGDSSTAMFNHLEAQINYRLHKRLYLTGGIDFYRRVTNYDMVVHNVKPRISSSQIGLHMMLCYKF